MANASPAESAEEQAARWAVRATYGGMTAEAHAALDAWLAADRLHRGAFLRARAGLYQMEDMVIDGRPLPDTGQDINPGFPIVRRTWFRVTASLGIALAASVAMLMVSGVRIPWFRGLSERTANQIVNLADGSMVTLRHGGRIKVALAANVRRITLLGGDASFHVAKDRSRPFVVQSGDVFAEATGTIYSVGRVGAIGATVTVSEGSVLVWTREERDQAVLLRAGGTLTLDPWPKPLEPQPANVPGTVPSHPLPPPELAQISLDNVSIGSAAARFNRLNSVKIVVTDPDVAATTIVGLFRANDPEQFAEAAAAITDARVHRERSKIVISKK